MGKIIAILTAWGIIEKYKHTESSGVVKSTWKTAGWVERIFGVALFCFLLFGLMYLYYGFE